MLAPALPLDEAFRLESLRALNVLDTASEERFDRLTKLAKKLFQVPIALISLVDADRQWFKSSQGLDAVETPRDISFCGHAILGTEILEVVDATRDERFHDNPFVTGAPDIRFYAGCPLTLPRGGTVGTLCLIDQRPRELDDEERELLRDLARMAEQELASLALATTDDLTGLSNRRGFVALADHALKACRRTGKPATSLFFDLDGFKGINDAFGHAEGDRALRHFAELLKVSLRESDVVARLGGDEFVAVLSDCDAAGAQACIGRLREASSSHNARLGSAYALRFSVGLVDFDPRLHTDIHAMLNEADRLMYMDKQARKARRAAA